jgi:DNA modification methylase
MMTGARRISRVESDTENQTSSLNNLSGKEWVKATKSWFIINPRPRTSRQITHPAKYPEELVEHLVRFFTHEEAWILDPFAGIGSTLVACKQLNRNSVGVELSDNYVRLGLAQLEKAEGNGSAYFLCGDARLTHECLSEVFGSSIPLFDFVMTSPPYWNMLRKSRGGNETAQKKRANAGLDLYYSDQESDIGNLASYDAYVETMGEIFDNIRDLLREGAYLVLVAQNMRDIDGVMKPIAWDLARRLSKAYCLRQEMIWCQDNKRLGCWGYPTTYVSNVHHHYCLVFQKASD